MILKRNVIMKKLIKINCYMLSIDWKIYWILSY